MPTWLSSKILIGAGIALALIAAFLWHRDKVHDLRKEAFDNGVKHEQARITKKVEALAVQMNKVAEDAQKLAEFDFKRIRGGTRTLLVSGPGKAACTGPIASAPGEHQRPDPAGGSAVAPVPGGQGESLFGLPATSAIVLGQNHDLCWAREKAWIKWYKGISEIGKKPD